MKIKNYLICARHDYIPIRIDFLNTIFFSKDVNWHEIRLLNQVFNSHLSLSLINQIDSKHSSYSVLDSALPVSLCDHQGDLDPGRSHRIGENEIEFRVLSPCALTAVLLVLLLIQVAASIVYVELPLTD